MQVDGPKKYKTYGKSCSLRLKDFDYSTEGVYLITAGTFGKKEFFGDPGLAMAVLECLNGCKDRFSYKIYGYCLMPDHIHLLLNPGSTKISVSRFMQVFKSLSTHTFWKHGGSGKLWQERFHDHVVRNDESLVEIAKYILDNPLRKGLVERPEDYPFSGTIDPFPI